MRIVLSTLAVCAGIQWFSIGMTSKVYAGSSGSKPSSTSVDRSTDSASLTDPIGRTVFGRGSLNEALVGTILKTFADGTAEVKWTKSNGENVYWAPAYWNEKDLFRAVRQINSFTKGQTVHGISSRDQHLIGTILSLFSDSTAEIKWRTAGGQEVYWHLSYWKTSTLHSEQKSFGRISVGQTVYSVSKEKNHLVGKVLNIFSDGTAEIKWRTADGKEVHWHLSYWPVSHLTPQSSSGSGSDSDSSSDSKSTSIQPKKLDDSVVLEATTTEPSAPPAEVTDIVQDKLGAPEAEEINQCPICTEKFSQQTKDLSYTPCGHKFHFRCLQKWMENPTAECPVCRNKIKG